MSELKKDRKLMQTPLDHALSRVVLSENDNSKLAGRKVNCGKIFHKKILVMKLYDSSKV